MRLFTAEAKVVIAYEAKPEETEEDVRAYMDKLVQSAERFPLSSITSFQQGWPKEKK